MVGGYPVFEIGRTVRQRGADAPTIRVTMLEAYERRRYTTHARRVQDSSARRRWRERDPGRARHDAHGTCTRWTSASLPCDTVNEAISAAAGVCHCRTGKAPCSAGHARGRRRRRWPVATSCSSSRPCASIHVAPTFYCDFRPGCAADSRQHRATRCWPSVWMAASSPISALDSSGRSCGSTGLLTGSPCRRPASISRR